VALNSGGQRGESEISLICISNDSSATCGATPAAEAAAEVDETIKVGGAPNPASIGASCNPADRIVTFEAYVENIGDAIEVDIHGYLVGTSGERYEFIVALSPGTTPGSYIGTLDLGTLYDAALGGADGRLEYTLSLLGPTKEWSRTSTMQTIQVHYCGGAIPVQGIVKVMGTRGNVRHRRSTSWPRPISIPACSTESTLLTSGSMSQTPGSGRLWAWRIARK
jgi:hypothetical protein